MSKHRQQPVRRPATWPEYEQIKHELIDTLGRPLVSEHCADCGRAHFTVEPCLRDVRCPQCGSTAQRCLRSSGWEATEWHQARRDLFDQLRDRLEVQGVPQVARWQGQ